MNDTLVPCQSNVDKWLDFSVTLVAILTSCHRPKVKQKSLSARPSGLLPKILKLRSPRIITLSHVAKSLQMFCLNFLRNWWEYLVTYKLYREERFKFLTLYFQPQLLKISFRYWGPFFNLLYPGIRISMSHTVGSKHHSETGKILKWLLVTVCLRRYTTSQSEC